jgi:hypothetical protein
LVRKILSWKGRIVFEFDSGKVDTDKGVNGYFREIVERVYKLILEDKLIERNNTVFGRIIFYWIRMPVIYWLFFLLGFELIINLVNFVIEVKDV